MQPVSTAPTSKPKGTVLLWVGGVAIVGGIVLGIALVVFGVKGLADTVNDYQRVSASEGGVVQIEDTGEYTVFLERPGIDEDTITFSGYALPTVVVQGPSGEPMVLSTSMVQETYSFGSRDGRKLGTFQADRPGAYRLVPRGGTTGRLAVGQGGVGDSLLQAGLGVLLGGAAVVIGIILMVIGGVRRGRSKRILVPIGYPGAAMGGGWAPPPTGPGGWAPPPHPGWAPPAGQGGWAAPPSLPTPPAPAGPPGWAPPPTTTPPPLPTTPPPLPSHPGADGPPSSGPIS